MVRKMSKSFGNSISPDDIVNRFGADTLRIYEMFMGPFEQAISWDSKGIEGCYRFLNRVYKLSKENVKNKKTPQNLTSKLHQTIKKVGDDLEKMKFNTAIAFMMEFINSWQEGYLNKKEAELFIKILAPFAPFLAEEVWCDIFKNKYSIHNQPWPKYDKNLINEEKIKIIIQVSGKLRGEVEISQKEANNEEKITKLAEKEPKVERYLKGKKIKKIIFVPEKIINFCRCLTKLR